MNSQTFFSIFLLICLICPSGEEQGADVMDIAYSQHPDVNMELQYNDIPYCAGTQVELTVITRYLPPAAGGLEDCAIGNPMAYLLYDLRYFFNVEITDNGDPSNNGTLSFDFPVDDNLISNHTSAATALPLGNGFSIYYDDTNWDCNGCAVSPDDSIYNNPDYYPYIGECDSETPRRPDYASLARQPNYVLRMLYTIPGNIVGPGTISFANTFEEGYIVLSSAAFGNYYLPPNFQTKTAEGNITSGGSSTPVITIDDPDNCAPLPIYLFNFEVEREGDAARVSWELTADDNSTVELQRSSDGLHFESLESFPLSSENRNGNHFQFLDEDPQSGMNYYRLKMNWESGFVEYSGLRSISFDETEKEIKIYPNPAVEQVHISDYSSVSSLSLLNADGKAVLTVDGGLSGGILDLSGLDAGMYILRIDTPGGIQTHKLVKLY